MKNGKVIKKLMLIVSILLALLTNVAWAHSGRTDSNGGHKDNKNVSGLGSYHYHCGGHPAHLHPNGVCPYATSTTNLTNTSSRSTSNKSSKSSNIVKNETTQKEIPTTIEVTEVSINQGFSIALEIGEKTTLSANITPNDATNKTITWLSSNPQVLKINVNGEVEAISAGTAQITVTSNNGKKSEVNIIVNPKPILIEQIILSKTNITLTQDEEVEIVATINPNNATNQNIRWESSDTKVATVINGKVKAKREGTVVIKAISENNIESQCTITVNAKENNSAGAVGTVGGLSVLGVIGAIIKSRIKKV